MSKPTKVTKVLIHKIHGGRKKDSKFWKSEFSDEEITKPKPSRPNISKLVFYPLILLALFILGYISYIVFNRYFVTPNLFTKNNIIQTESIYSPPSYEKKSRPNRSKPSYSNKSKDKPVTKRDLDRAIDKALKMRSTKSVSSLPYYRVELTNGSVIRAKSAIKNGTHFTIKNTQGTEFSMLRSDIKNVEKIFPE